MRSDHRCPAAPRHRERPRPEVLRAGQAGPGGDEARGRRAARRGPDGPLLTSQAVRLRSSRRDRGPGADEALRRDRRRRRPVVRGRSPAGSPASSARTAPGKSTTLRCMVDLDRPQRGLDPLRRAGRSPSSSARCTRSARCSTPATSTRRGAAATTCGPSPRANGIGALAGRRGARDGRAHDRRQAQGRHLLARHAPAPRARPGDARRPAGHPARRAGQRPRPRGHPVGAGLPEGAGRPGSHRVRVEPPAGRDGADGRRPRRHRPRAACIAQTSVDEFVAQSTQSWVVVRSPDGERLAPLLRGRRARASSRTATGRCTCTAPTRRRSARSPSANGVLLHELARTPARSRRRSSRRRPTSQEFRAGRADRHCPRSGQPPAPQRAAAAAAATGHAAAPARR